ncbi:cell growth-regulating nucleolar protein-like [Oppia nitens]|uniref:cell growth-regulating nucleolar protein-like n=1 Tax=Oppia nitens TaxID=1686743 RepID=UPI0023DBD2AD|nr:cell growth-regulating nucleolar protein-like [Oppia nitens]
MVFFTCNSCGESLKKIKVIQHLSHCSAKSISCVDCGKDFTDDYIHHNQCISEDQKYGGLNYQAKPGTNKGKDKQENWVQKVKSVINEMDTNSHLRGLMQKLVLYDNIPRKRPKFTNFIKNCIHITNESYIQQMWDIFEKVIKSDETTNNNNNNNNNNNSNKQMSSPVVEKRVADNEDNQQNSTKRKKFKKTNGIQSDDNNNNNEETNEVETNDNEEETEVQPKTKTKIKINKLIVEILRETEGNQLKIKKLRKRVLKRYKSLVEDYDKETVVSKFDKRIHKNKKISINEGLVSLIV